jgi:hypothetical protein
VASPDRTHCRGARRASPRRGWIRGLFRTPPDWSAWVRASARDVGVPLLPIRAIPPLHSPATQLLIVFLGSMPRLANAGNPAPEGTMTKPRMLRPKAKSPSDPILELMRARAHAKSMLDSANARATDLADDDAEYRAAILEAEHVLSHFLDLCAAICRTSAATIEGAIARLPGGRRCHPGSPQWRSSRH